MDQIEDNSIKYRAYKFVCADFSDPFLTSLEIRVQVEQNGQVIERTTILLGISEWIDVSVPIGTSNADTLLKPTRTLLTLAVLEIRFPLEPNKL